MYIYILILEPNKEIINFHLHFDSLSAQVN